MAYSTNNPLGSSDPRDLYDNAENLDYAVNSSADTFQDRLGKSRLTLKGMEQVFDGGQPAIDAYYNAVEEADRAAAQVPLAAAEADRAETAADAATVNADVYTDTTAGIAGTVDGEQFQVVEGDEIVRYENQSEVAVELFRYPSSQVFDSISSSSPFGLEPSVASIQDEDGRQLLRFDDLGDAYFAGTLADAEFTEKPLTEIPGNTGLRYPVAHYNAFLVRGQSNAIGSGGTTPAITTSAIDNAWMLDDTRSPNPSAGSFTPLKEGAVSDIESLCGGFSGQALEMILKSVPPWARFDHDLVCGCNGAAGEPIASLVKGTSLYNAGLDFISASKAIADGLSESFVHSAWAWLQGESDSATDIGTYKTAFLAMLSDWASDTKQITGQSIDPLCVSYQVRSGNAAQAQYEMARDNGIVIAAPTYQLDYVDSAHYTNHGMRELAAHFAKVYFARVVSGIQWLPLHPTSVSYTPSTIVITFHVPGQRLTWDFSKSQSISQSAASVDSYNALVNGFSVLDSDGVYKGIERIEITGKNQITITMQAATLTAGDQLRYGYGGYLTTPGGTLYGTDVNGGNLRDDGKDILTKFTNADGVDYPLHNWCLKFKETL